MNTATDTTAIQEPTTLTHETAYDFNGGVSQFCGVIEFTTVLNDEQKEIVLSTGGQAMMKFKVNLLKALYLRLYDMDRTPSEATVSNPHEYEDVFNSKSGVSFEWSCKARFTLAAEITRAEQSVVLTAWKRAAEEFEEALAFMDEKLARSA